MNNNSSPYLHSWNFKRNAFVIKFYTWVLGEDALNKINFCKLFWFLLFSPLILLGWGFLLLFAAAVDVVDEKMRDHRKVTALRVKPSRLTLMRQWLGRALTGFGHAIMRFAGFIARHGNKILWALGVCALGGLGYLAYYSSLHIPGLIRVLEVAGLTVGIGVGLMVVVWLIVVAFYWIDDNTNFFDNLPGFLKRFFGAIYRFFAVIFRFIGTGLASVKYRTCPLIHVASEEK